MKWIFNLLLLIISAISSGQSIENTNNTQPTKTAALLLSRPALTANIQYQRLNNNPADANAWLQFYVWLHKQKNEKAAQDQTLENSGKYITGSWQYSLMNFIASGKRDFKAIKYAIDHAENKAVIYPYAIHYAIIASNKNLLNEYAEAYNKLAPLSPALYEYHYNTLNSAGLHAVVYGKGLTDLAPLAVLQQVYGIRTDVELKYYEGEINNKQNSYICLSAGKETVEKYPDAGYSGLLINLSENTDIESLQKTLEGFTLENLHSAIILKEDEKTIYKNYIPSFILVYKFLKNKQLPTSQKWKANLQKLGILTGTTTAIEQAIAE